MPELPEVENFARALSSEYGGKIIRIARLHRSDLRSVLDKQAILSTLSPKATFLGASRDGKRLVLRTDHGELLVSLGMSGAFLPADPKRPKTHEHMTVVFTDGTAFGYVDPRRFGHIEPRKGPLPHLADPLKRGSVLALLSSPSVGRSKRSIKDILLDQRLIGGIGNIYALEALHIAGIRPTRRAYTVRREERSILATALISVLRRAIKMGGSTIATYRTLGGDPGTFQNVHRVYGRADLPCRKNDCRGTIKRIVQSGRSSFFCPVCQK